MYRTLNQISGCNQLNSIYQFQLEEVSTHKSAKTQWLVNLHWHNQNFQLGGGLSQHCSFPPPMFYTSGLCSPKYTYP